MAMPVRNGPCGRFSGWCSTSSNLQHTGGRVTIVIIIITTTTNITTTTGMVPGEDSQDGAPQPQTYSTGG